MVLRGSMMKAFILLVLFGWGFCGMIPARAVFYEDPPDTPITEDGFLIRFVGSEIVLNKGTIQYPDRNETILYALPIWGEAAVGVLGKDTYDAMGMDAGTPIGPQIPWNRNSGRLVYITCPTNPAGPCTSRGAWSGAVHYLGISFTDELGTRYGWVRLSHAGADAPLILHDYAIETTPGIPLLAGSHETAMYEAQRCLRFAAGFEKASPADIALLDQNPKDGEVNIADATTIIRLLIPPIKG